MKSGLFLSLAASAGAALTQQQRDQVIVRMDFKGALAAKKAAGPVDVKAFANTIFEKAALQPLTVELAACINSESTIHLNEVGLSVINANTCGQTNRGLCSKFEQFAANAGVDVVCEQNFEVRATGQVKPASLNDPMTGQQWASNRAHIFDDEVLALDEMNAQAATKKVVVAVIDTGIDYTHEDLKDAMWVNPLEPECQKPASERDPSADADGNGVLDCHGMNFENPDAVTGDPLDDNMHGSHCGGVIGATRNNNIGIAGASSNVELMALKFLGASGSGSIAGAIAAMNYAIEKKVDIMSNSWGGGPRSDLLLDCLKTCEQRGILFVVAAGNENSDNDGWYPAYPCSFRTESSAVLCVAAMDKSDHLASYSNWGAKSVDIGAGGSDVLSTVPGNRYAELSGTSMATPLVAGLAAVVKTYLAVTGGDASAANVLRIIDESGERVKGLKKKLITGRVINAVRAMALVRGEPLEDPEDDDDEDEDDCWARMGWPVNTIPPPFTWPEWILPCPADLFSSYGFEMRLTDTRAN